MRHQYLTGVTLVLCCCPVYSAEEVLDSNFSFQAADRWEPNVLTGASLVSGIKRGRELAGYQTYDPSWVNVTSRGESWTMPVLRNRQQPTAVTYPPLSLHGGFIESDLLDKRLLWKKGDSILSFRRESIVAVTLLTPGGGDGDGVGGALMRWKLDSTGVLLITHEADFSNSIRRRLLKRDNDKLTFERDGMEEVWEYLPVKK